MYSIIYNPEVKTFSVSTKMFGHGNKNKNKGGGLPRIVDEDWKTLSRSEQEEFNKIQDAGKRKDWANRHNVKIKESNNNNNNGGNKDNDRNKDASNYYTKNSPKIYAFKKLLKKNLEELKRDHRIIEYNELGDNIVVETPNDIYLNIYTTADGDYIITKLEMDGTGYASTSRRFNAIVAGPKELRDIITNVRRLEEPGILKKLFLRGVGSITGTDIVDPVKFKLW